MCLRSLVKRIAFDAWLAAGAYRSRLARLRASERITIVNLHRISPHANPFWMPLHPRVFDGLVSFLKDHFDLRTILECDLRPSNRPVAVLSFDDGYQDFVEYAMPVLEKHGVRVNQNVVGSSLETGRPPWETRLYDFLAASPLSLLRELRIPGVQLPAVDASTASKVAYGLSLSRHLKWRSNVERAPVLAMLEEFVARAEPRYTRMMSIGEVVGAARCHEIGAHSWAHDSMAFEDNDYFRRDLERCQSCFSRNLGIPAHIYAFPNGSYRTEQLDILRTAGVQKALLVDEGSAQREAFALPRRTLYADSVAEAIARAVGVGGRP